MEEGGEAEWASGKTCCQDVSAGVWIFGRDESCQPNFPKSWYTFDNQEITTKICYL